MHIDYKPSGTAGYTCELLDGARLTVTVTLSENGTETEVVPSTLPTQAVVGAVQRYADNEFERRRARNPEKRSHHEKEAAKWKKAALEIVPLVTDLGDDTEDGWCSDCMTKSKHQLVRSRTKFKTRRYICLSCGSPTGKCDVPRCKNFADRGGGPNEKSRFCAEHNHDIPSFEKLGAPVASLEEYVPWLEFERFNAKKYSKVTAMTVAGAAVVGPVAFMAAPAIGGAIGVYSGLYGAAATSHGLALLGGGSLAAGGFGMSGGIAVVSAAGAGLGAASGASVANAYVRNDKSFGFEKVRDGDETTVIFANGFLSEGQTGWGDWERIVAERYPTATVYRVTWGSKELKSLTSFVARAPAAISAAKAAAELALQASKVSTRLLGPLGAALAGASMAKNPWHVARTRASMTGAVVADAIVRARLESVVLVGFSLGGRVMTAAAESLATLGGVPRIDTMHLLGAAVGTRRDWRTIETAVAGDINNYFSKNDGILSGVYRVGEAGTKAIGSHGIPSTSPKIKNIDVSKTVAGHRDHLKFDKLR